MNSRNDRALYYLLILISILLGGVFIRMLYTAYLFPIYPDEIAIRITSSRMLYDLPFKVNLFPVCGLLKNKYPIVWYFPGLVEWILYAHIENLKILRLFGIFTSCTIFLAISIFLYKNIANTLKPNKIFFLIVLGFVLSLVSIGVMPFYWVTVRPEQTIILLLVVLLYIYCFDANTKLKQILQVTLYFASVSILLYIHPKTLLLTPVFLLIAHKILSKFTNSIKIILMLFLCFLIIDNLYEWKKILECSSSMNMENFINNSSLSISDIIYHPLLFWSNLKDSVIKCSTLVEGVLFQYKPEINYIPSFSYNKFIFINYLLSINYITIFIALCLASIWLYIVDFKKGKFYSDSLLGITILLCIFISAIFNLSKHWYDAGYVWSLIVVAIVWFLRNSSHNFLCKKISCIAILYIIICSCVSLIYFINKYEKEFKTGFSGPSISIYQYDHKEIKQELDILAKNCHIDKSHSKYLVLDDLTYLYFQKSRYPIAVTYITYNSSKEFWHSFWKKIPIDGIIIRKYDWPQDVMQYTVESKHFICVPKRNINLYYKAVIKNGY